MKIIFLDIDGVICLSREWGSRKNKTKRWELEGGEDSILTDNSKICFISTLHGG